MLVEEHGSPNKILIVPVEGVISSDAISSSGDYNLVHFIKDQFRMAAQEDEIKAVILKVDSPGGEVLASDDINRIIKQFQDKTGKPVIASMGNLAASGGYYVSAPCRWIVANELTLTGSIGVISHSYNIRGLMDKVGVRPEVYKSGKFKDMLSFDKKETDITQEERDMVQKLIDETFAQFKGVVADGRAWAYRENSKYSKGDKGVQLASNWADYADGRVLSGKEAFKLGFVDELGNFDAAVSRAKKLASIPNANLVQYQQVFDLSNLFRLFGKSEGTKIKVDLGLDTPKLKAGQLYYLAPNFVQ
jgi:protease-4